MESEKIKIQIGGNIARLRRQTGITQAELAEKLNYSDKAVSKWERGESVPDIAVLIQMSRLFGVTVDELIGEEAPQASRKPEKKKNYRRCASGNVLLLCSVLVWFVALTLYVVFSSIGISKSWVCFVYAVPVNAIVLLSLLSAGRNYRWNLLLISLIVWGVLMTVYITLLVFAGANIWKMFLLGLLGQAAIVLWFHTIRAGKSEAEHEQS